MIQCIFRRCRCHMFFFVAALCGSHQKLILNGSSHWAAIHSEFRNPYNTIYIHVLKLSIGINYPETFAAWLKLIVLSCTRSDSVPLILYLSSKTTAWWWFQSSYGPSFFVTVLQKSWRKKVMFKLFTASSVEEIKTIEYWDADTFESEVTPDLYLCFQEL